MNIYELAARNSPSGELAKLIADLSDENRRLRAAFDAAKAFIEAATSEDPSPMADGLYDEYVEAGRDL